MNPYQETIRTFDKHAMGYQQKYMDVGHYSEGLNFLTDSLMPSASILELGCGPGNVSRYLLQRRSDFVLKGTDASPEMVSLARKNNPVANFEVMDARAIDQLETTFDSIVCAFVLPYLSAEDVQKLILDAFNLLDEAGMIYLSTMEDEYEKSGYRFSADGKDRCYMYFYKAEEFCLWLENAGFKIAYLKRQPFPPEGEQTATDLIIIASKNR